MIMQHRILPALALVAIFGLATGHAAPVSYTLPDETAAFKPGANLETARRSKMRTSEKSSII
jgi:sulfite dehydrogenase (cytochrome) subunit B